MIFAMNIFIDPETGYITGFIDCVDPKILPFGLVLCGVLNVMGGDGLERLALLR